MRRIVRKAEVIGTSGPGSTARLEGDTTQVSAWASPVSRGCDSLSGPPSCRILAENRPPESPDSPAKENDLCRVAADDLPALLNDLRRRGTVT